MCWGNGRASPGRTGLPVIPEIRGPSLRKGERDRTCPRHARATPSQKNAYGPRPRHARASVLFPQSSRYPKKIPQEDTPRRYPKKISQEDIPGTVWTRRRRYTLCGRSARGTCCPRTCPPGRDRPPRGPGGNGHARVRSASVSSIPIVRPASGPRPVRVRCRFPHQRVYGRTDAARVRPASRPRPFLVFALFCAEKT
eukprot:gene10596-biopygen21326